MAFISIGALNRGGVNTDHPSYDLPPEVFNEAEDVEFTTEGVIPAFKEIAGFDGVQINPLMLEKVKLGAGTEGVIYGGLQKLYMIFNGVHTDITRVPGDGGLYSALEDIGWNTAILHGIPVLNNGFDVPQQVDPLNAINPVTNLDNWPSTLLANVIRPYREYLIAIGVKTGSGPYDQQSIIWSDPADPGSVPPSWDFTDPATQAGLKTFSETDDRLVDGLSLGDEFIVYKEQSIYAMRFIGGTFVFSFKRRPGEVGLLASDCVVNFPGGHFLVGQEDLYVYNGVGTPKSVASGRVKETFFQTLTSGQKLKTFVVHDPVKKIIGIFYAADGSIWPNKKLIWNYELNTWTFRNVPQVSDVTFGAFDAIIQKSWDDLIDTWGGKLTDPWADITGTWAAVPDNWAALSDQSAWDTDGTAWNDASVWDDPNQPVWDISEFEPNVDSLLMSTYLTDTPVFNPVTNTSTANGVTWAGDAALPPIWVVPNEGERLQGRLLKKSLAIVGKNRQGQVEVNRTVNKILSEFYPEVNEGSLQIRFGTHDVPEGTIDWEDFETFDSTTDLKLDPLLNAKYLAFEVQGTGEGEGNWLFSGYGMEIQSGGRY